MGVPLIGGAIVTGSALTFVAATFDDYLRAFDVTSGEELWKGRLPAGDQATPMTYAIDGRQYVVIAAGGHGGGRGRRAGTMWWRFAQITICSSANGWQISPGYPRPLRR